MSEYKTLRQLNVQHGDVVQYEHDPPRTVADISNDGSCGMTDKSRWFWGNPQWTLVSRAADRQEAYSGNKPILLRDLTAEQIDLLVQAGLAYRARPKPHIEVVDLIADGRVVGTIEIEDGKINPTSAVWEVSDE